MKNFNDLSANELEGIIENRINTVISIDVPTANRVGEAIGITRRITQYHYPQLLIDKTLSTKKIDSSDIINKWETFMILIENSGAEVFYRLENLVDCTYDIRFSI